MIDATYVINMDSDAGRLATFDTMMKSLSWPYTHNLAVNGKKLFKRENDNIPNLEENLSLKNKYVSLFNFLSHSEIGCLLSHVKLWEFVVNNPNLNRIAIFEDDARTHMKGTSIQDILNEFYQYLEKNNIEEPDMLYLGKALDR